MTFQTKHKVFGTTAQFTDNNPPKWLIGGPKGSTMDMLWFLEEHVLTLNIGQSIEADWHTITRIA